MPSHPVWFILTAAAIVWYSTVTIFVAVKGADDIHSMLRRLDDSAEE